jgi:Plasmid pRiA4b ORF-3-like protein
MCGESRRSSHNRRPPKAKFVALRIELLDETPLVWRRIVVTNQWTFANLHHYLQWVMGWWDSHPQEFQVCDQVVAPDWWIEEIGLDPEGAKYRDERRFSIAAAVSELGIRGEIEYRYDMGDDWHRRLVIETPPAAWDENGLPLPACGPATVADVAERASLSMSERLDTAQRDEFNVYLEPGRVNGHRQLASMQAVGRDRPSARKKGRGAGRRGCGCSVYDRIRAMKRSVPRRIRR